MRVLAAIAALLSGGVANLAALEWKTTEVQAKASLGEAGTTATFAYRNTSGRPVRILAVVPSCDCLSAMPSAPVCAPGESGSIEVDFRFAGSVGHQVKTVAVTSDDAPASVTTLTLAVDIPEPVAARPRFLFWKVGASPDEKAAKILVAQPGQVTLGSIRSSNPLFAVRLVPESSGSSRLLVKPASTQAAADGIVELSVTFAGRTDAYRVFLAVR